MRTLLALALTACTPADPADPYAVPDGAPAGVYEPWATLDVFPDDVQTVADPSTPTGRRVHLTPGVLDFLDTILPPGFTLVEALEELDGFGTNAGVVLRFDTPLDPTTITDAVRFVRLDDGTDVDWEVWWTDGGATPVLQPLFPLAPATPHAVILTDAVQTEGGETPWTPERLHALLRAGLGPGTAHVEGLWRRALHHTGLHPDEVVHGTVFTTQSLWDQDEAVFDAIQTLSPRLKRAGPCEDRGTTTTCPATLATADFVGEDRTIHADEDPSVQRTHTLQADVHLPGDGTGGPFPVVIDGHGLAGDRGEANGVARNLAAEGFAVVAVDAPYHAYHPTVISPGELFWVFEFFGADIDSLTLDVLRLRDTFRQGAWDRLQLAAAVRAGFDADGDGDDDLVGPELQVTGHSLGGLMGAQLAAMDPQIGSAWLSVPGGRMGTIVHRSPTFAPVISLLAPDGVSPDEVDRFFPLMQAAIDRGDPATWARRLLDDGRDVAIWQVMDDTIMPAETTTFMGRAAGLQIVAPVLEDVPGLHPAPDGSTIRGNVDGQTAVYLQVDTLVTGETTERALHTNIFGTDTNVLPMRHWLRTRLDEGRAELVLVE